MSGGCRLTCRSVLACGCWIDDFLPYRFSYDYLDEDCAGCAFGVGLPQTGWLLDVAGSDLLLARFCGACYKGHLQVLMYY